jgi:hypothetical protein
MNVVPWEERTLRTVPFLRVLRDGPDACHLLTSERTTFRVQGRGVPFLLDAILPAFDAPLRVGALPERLAAGVEEEALRALLGALLRNGILRDATDAPPLSADERTTHRDTLSLLSRLSDRPEAHLAKLREARVLSPRLCARAQSARCASWRARTRWKRRRGKRPSRSDCRTGTSAGPLS